MNVGRACQFCGQVLSVSDLMSAHARGVTVPGMKNGHGLSTVYAPAGWCLVACSITC